jgi:uncharacterized OB-fold protein
VLSKPTPRIDETSRPFWEACNAERVLIQRCANPECRRFNYYPRVCCPVCHSGALEWAEASGEAEIVTHTTIHRTHHDSFNSEAPFVFAAVRLLEGPVVYARIKNAPSDGASLLGRRVKAVFEQLSAQQKLLAFRLE